MMILKQLRNISFLVLLLAVSCQKKEVATITTYTDLEKLNLKGAVKSVFELETHGKNSFQIRNRTYKKFNPFGKVVEYGTWRNSTKTKQNKITLDSLPIYSFNDYDNKTYNEIKNKSIWADTLVKNSVKKYNDSGALVEQLIYFNANNRDLENVHKKYYFIYDDNDSLIEFQHFTATKDTLDYAYEQLNNDETISPEYIDYIAWVDFGKIQFNAKGYPTNSIENVHKEGNRYNQYHYDLFNYDNKTVRKTIFEDDHSHDDKISEQLILSTRYPLLVNDEIENAPFYLYNLKILKDTLGINTVDENNNVTSKIKKFKSSTFKDSIQEKYNRIYKHNILSEVEHYSYTIDTNNLLNETQQNAENVVQYLNSRKEYEEYITFNMQGDITKIKLVNYDLGKEIVTIQYKYRYDEFNNWIYRKEVINNRKEMITKRKIEYYK